MSGSTDPDDGFERLLRGVPPEDPEERHLGAFVEDVRSAFPAAPLLAEERHLSAIGAAARLLVREGGRVNDGAGERSKRARIRERRRFDVKVPMFRSLAAKIVAGIAVLMWSLGGLAVAGALPGGLEDVVSNAADDVLVNLSDDDGLGDDEGENADVEDEADDDQGDDADVEDEGADDQGENDQGDDDQGDDDQGDDDSEDDGEDSDDGDDDDADGEDSDDGDDDSEDDGEDSDDGDDDDSDDEDDDEDDEDSDDEDD